MTAALARNVIVTVTVDVNITMTAAMAVTGDVLFPTFQQKTKPDSDWR